MGYLCSSGSRNVEGFEVEGFKLVDNTNLNNVKSKDTDGQCWGYLGGVQITSSNVEGDQTRTLNLKFVENNGAINVRRLNKLKSEFGVSDGLPFIFHFNVNGTFYVFRTNQNGPQIDGNNMKLQTKASMMNIDDFTELKNKSGTLELRVGIYDRDNKSQRETVRSVFEAVQ